jgi:hypothetical protein
VALLRKPAISADAVPISIIGGQGIVIQVQPVVAYRTVGIIARMIRT